ncbi:DUF2239 family protein [Phenylobacterium aquaticum]|uniref:DUF2239 family protein n=1 Tax=Phenylobacterium aquaticum TaxID=1763816 RepID=UPI0026E9A194|nr:DUF2239 family protein [Phenylobacterium aquaticum]
MSVNQDAETYTAFSGARRLVSGPLAIASAAAQAEAEAGATHLVILSDQTGRAVDPAATPQAPSPQEKPARGRPKLGVTAREVTLLPRHWDWLATQPGGASAALRRLVDAARRDNLGADQARQAQEALHRAMTVLAGDLPGYEEALRSLYSGDRERFDGLTAAWPIDIANYLHKLSGRG